MRGGGDGDGGECKGGDGECKGGDEVDYPLAQLRSTTRPRGRAAQPRPTGDGHEIALGPHVVLRQLERRPSNSMRSTSSGRGNGATQCCRRCVFLLPTTGSYRRLADLVRLTRQGKGPRSR